MFLTFNFYYEDDNSKFSYSDRAFVIKYLNNICYFLRYVPRSGTMEQNL